MLLKRHSGTNLSRVIRITAIKLKLDIDTRYGEIGEYFEIFMERMLLCRKAAEFLQLEFHLIINEQTLM